MSEPGFFDALLGRIFSRGVEQELEGAVNFVSPLKAAKNGSTLDITLEVADLGATGAAPGQLYGDQNGDCDVSGGNYVALDGGETYAYAGNPDLAAGTGASLVYSGDPIDALFTLTLTVDPDSLAAYQLEASIDLNSDTIGETTSLYYQTQYVPLLHAVSLTATRLISLEDGDVVSGCVRVATGVGDTSIHIVNVSLTFQA